MGTLKAAVIGLTRHLATHWVLFNVRVNAITPGGVENWVNPTLQAPIQLGRPAGTNGTSRRYGPARSLHLCLMHRAMSQGTTSLSMAGSRSGRPNPEDWKGKDFRRAEAFAEPPDDHRLQQSRTHIAVMRMTRIVGGAHTYLKGDYQFPCLALGSDCTLQKREHVWHVDGNEYVDCWLGLGFVSLGHAVPTCAQAGVLSFGTGVAYSSAHLSFEPQVGRAFLALCPGTGSD